MKLITINVSEQEHKEIKMNATKAGLSIKEYLLGKPTIQEIVQPKQTERAKRAVNTAIQKSITDQNEKYIFCKHGSDPKFCKFSKPGKPCK